MKLRDVFDDFRCQRALLKNLETRSAQAGGDDFLRNVASFPGSDNLPIDPNRRRAEISRTIERMYRRLDDFYLVGLVSAFENFVFSKLQSATRLAEHTLKENYAPDAPVWTYRAGLAKTLADFGQLGDLNSLFEKGLLTPDQTIKLRELIHLRSFIAHGRRQDWNRAKELNNFPVDVVSAYHLLKTIADSL